MPYTVNVLFVRNYKIISFLVYTIPVRAAEDSLSMYLEIIHTSTHLCAS